MIALETEVVVIGSGFGGAVAASRLVEQNVAVIMLERGPWRNTLPVNSMNVREHEELPVKSFSYLVRNTLMAVCHHKISRARGIGINRNRGTYEVHFHESFTSVASSQVGGGSLIWGGLVDRPLDPHFWDEIAGGVSEQLLKPHFARVKNELGVCSVTGHKIDFPRDYLDELQDDNHFDLSINGKTLAAHKLFEPEQDNQLPYGIVRNKSLQKEHLSFGCLDGSKASTDAVYIGPALANGLQLLAQCEVESIQQDKNGGYCIYAHHLVTKQSIEIRCNKVVMGAGAYHTVRLLLEAQRDNKLQPMPGLGKGMGVNGDEMSIVLDIIKGDGEEQRKGLFTCFNLVEGNERLLHGFINPDFPWPSSKFLRRLLRPVLRSSILVCMGEDIANGIAKLNKKRMQISYQPRHHDVNRTAAEQNYRIAKLLGKKSINFGKTLTAHIFGGARVAQDSGQGAVNGLGECHQNPGLYVVDASAIPKAPGKPPSLNIAVWASHVAENLAAHCNRGTQTAMSSGIAKKLTNSKSTELAFLFSTLPVAQLDQGGELTGQWQLKNLTADHWWQKLRFFKLFDTGVGLNFSVNEENLKTLRPHETQLNIPVLANSWDGSGLVFQVNTAIKGQQIAMQIRKLPGREAWLVRSANKQSNLGWHILSKGFQKGAEACNKT